MPVTVAVVIVAIIDHARGRDHAQIQDHIHALIQTLNQGQDQAQSRDQEENHIQKGNTGTLQRSPDTKTGTTPTPTEAGAETETDTAKAFETKTNIEKETEIEVGIGIAGAMIGSETEMNTETSTDGEIGAETGAETGADQDTNKGHQLRLVHHARHDTDDVEVAFAFCNRDSWVTASRHAVLVIRHRVTTFPGLYKTCQK